MPHTTHVLLPASIPSLPVCGSTCTTSSPPSSSRRPAPYPGPHYYRIAPFYNRIKLLLLWNFIHQIKGFRILRTARFLFLILVFFECSSGISLNFPSPLQVHFLFVIPRSIFSLWRFFWFPVSFSRYFWRNYLRLTGFNFFLRCISIWFMTEFCFSSTHSSSHDLHHVCPRRSQSPTPPSVSSLSSPAGSSWGRRAVRKYRVITFLHHLRVFSFVDFYCFLWLFLMRQNVSQPKHKVNYFDHTSKQFPDNQLLINLAFTVHLSIIYDLLFISINPWPFPVIIVTIYHNLFMIYYFSQLNIYHFVFPLFFLARVVLIMHIHTNYDCWFEDAAPKVWACIINHLNQFIIAKIQYFWSHIFTALIWIWIPVCFALHRPLQSLDTLKLVGCGIGILGVFLYSVIDDIVKPKSPPLLPK